MPTSTPVCLVCCSPGQMDTRQRGLGAAAQHLPATSPVSKRPSRPRHCAGTRLQSPCSYAGLGATAAVGRLAGAGTTTAMSSLAGAGAAAAVSSSAVAGATERSRHPVGKSLLSLCSNTGQAAKAMGSREGLVAMATSRQPPQQGLRPSGCTARLRPSLRLQLQTCHCRPQTRRLLSA